MATISTHHGTAAHRAHNIRAKTAVQNQEHIQHDMSTDNIVLIDETPAKAYQRIFGDALKRYNDKQLRKDRQIKNYYSNVKNDKRKVPVYESLIGVYPSAGETLSQDENITILIEYLEQFKKTNSNLEVIGAYIHLDEANPHMHLDYIPVGHDYKRGMDTQVSMERALTEQGYYTRGSKNTALMHWTKDTNKLLEAICVKHGLDVEHPEAGKGIQHLNTEMYKLSQDIRSKRAELDNINKQLDPLQQKLARTQRDIDALERIRLAQQEQIEAIEHQADQIVNISPETFKGNKKQMLSAYQDAQQVIRHLTSSADYKTFRTAITTSIPQLIQRADNAEQKNGVLSSQVSQLARERDNLQERLEVSEREKVIAVGVAVFKEARDTSDKYGSIDTDELKELVYRKHAEIFDRQPSNKRRNDILDYVEALAKDHNITISEPVKQRDVDLWER